MGLSLNLVVSSLVVARGEKPVIDGLSFEAPGGSALIVTGANGAGKTTLLRALAGLLSPASGAIRLDGGDPERTVAEHCCFVGHADAVKSGLTVFENLSFWARYLGGDARRDRVERALDAFALRALAHAPVRYLSAGQKRRAGLARVLAAHRPLWLLDEPTASLDAAAASLLADAVDAHTSDGGVAIVATHLPLAFRSATELRLG